MPLTTSSTKASTFDCPVCAAGTVRRATAPYEVTFRERTITVPGAEVRRRDSCGEVYLAPGQSDALQRMAADIARAEMRLVTGAEIARFCEALGLSQAELEAAMAYPRRPWRAGR